MPYLILVLAFLPFERSAAEDEEDGQVWTESIHSKSGTYAISINSANRSVLLIRADDRALGPQQLRVRLIRDGNAPLELVLRKIAAQEPPFRYVVKSSDWDGRLTGFELQSSADGHKWTDLGKFQKPASP